MERRKFIASSSVIGIATTVKSAPIVKSAFTNFNAQILLQEFGVESKEVFKKFKTEIILNLNALGLNQKIVNRITMPVEIVSNNVTKFNETVTYKNEAGDFITLSIQNGVDKIKIVKSIA